MVRCLRSFAFVGTFLLAGCARDVVVKPIAAEFVNQAGPAIKAVSDGFDAAIADNNAATAGWLAANPDCGLSDQIALRTPAAAQFLVPPVAVPNRGRGRGDTLGRQACLTPAELDQIATAMRAAGKSTVEIDRVTGVQPLGVLGRDDFRMQLALVSVIQDYVLTIAQNIDEPSLTAKDEILASAASIKAFGGGLQAFRAGLKGKPAAPGAFADGGAVDRIGGALGELANAIEIIARQGRDVRAIRAAVAGPTGRDIDAKLKSLAIESDDWACVGALARLASLNRYKDLNGPRFARIPFEERQDIATQFVNQLAILPPQLCSTGNAAPLMSSTRQLLEGLKVAHGELRRVAVERKLTPDERRREIRATLARLGGVFKAAGALALSVQTGGAGG